MVDFLSIKYYQARVLEWGAIAFSIIKMFKSIGVFKDFRPCNLQKFGEKILKIRKAEFRFIVIDDPINCILLILLKGFYCSVFIFCILPLHWVFYFAFCSNTTWHVESQFPSLGLNLCPPQWQLGVLITGEASGHTGFSVGSSYL